MVDHVVKSDRIPRLWRVSVASFINPATGQLHNAERSNLGTLVGAVCFFIGALLLLPERTEEVTAAMTAPGADG